MNRRRFLYAGTSAALTASARSYARISGANDRVGLGIIGLGRRSAQVANAFAQDPRVDIRAICDVYDAQTARFANALFRGKPQPEAYVRYDGLLADIMTHWVDVAQWMMDDARPARAALIGGIYELHDGRENPDTVSAIVQYKDWNLNLESSVLPIRNKRPSVFFEGTEGTLDLSREGYTYTPNQGEPAHVPVKFLNWRTPRIFWTQSPKARTFPRRFPPAWTRRFPCRWRCVRTGSAKSSRRANFHSAFAH